MRITILENEYWWFGQVNLGHEMPVSKDGSICGSMNNDVRCDQFTPIALSSKGRYIWSDKAFEYEVKNGEIIISGDGEPQAVLNEGYENLRGAYLAAQEAHFKFTGETPDLLFLQKPQYNTWIELKTEQTEQGIIKYAKGIVENGMPAGVFMIDGGWQEEYGILDFNARKVPDPGRMVKELHEMGFKVMLWTSPIVTSAGTRYKELRDKGYLIRTPDGEPAIRKWWSGYSAVLDLSNPEAVKWYKSQLDSLCERYGIDGYKFDAGDIYFYDDNDLTYTGDCAREQTKHFVVAGEVYPFNEFRSAWNCGGRPIVARLHDKEHKWENGGLDMLIPQTIIQGLGGYAYCCPDMVGGGEVQSFTGKSTLDSELFIRWAQANALMGMMQISIAPWRIFDKETFEIIKKALMIHASVGDYCVELAKHAAKTGEPIVRHMDYEFPGQGFENVCDQFMLGDKYLAAPVLKKGQTERNVKLPAGFKWKSDKGEIFEGGQIITEIVPIDRLAYYEKI